MSAGPGKKNRLIGYAGYLIGLWALGALDNVEFDLIAFFEALVTFALDGCVMDEYIGALVATEETVHFTVPLYCATCPTPLAVVVELCRSESTPLNSL